MRRTIVNWICRLGFLSLFLVVGGGCFWLGRQSVRLPAASVIEGFGKGNPRYSTGPTAEEVMEEVYKMTPDDIARQIQDPAEV
jgi:hypothetical protein